MTQLQNCLELADGTVLENASCGYSNRNLWCWVPKKTMAECFQMFSDLEKTKVIRCHYYTESITYNGFTDLLTVQKTENETGETQINICMTWPEGGEHSIIKEEKAEERTAEETTDEQTAEETTDEQTAEENA